MKQSLSTSRFWPIRAFRTKVPFLLASAAAALIIPAAMAQTDSPNNPVTGIWYDDTGKGAVKITECGAKQICGHIYWLKNPLNEEGKPLHDAYNPDKAKQSRPICGLQVLDKVEMQSDGTYDNGFVYDPKVGYTFNVAVNLVDPKKLHVRGYAKLKLFGESLYWTRAPDDLAQCSN